jgi:hypothetical protein
MSRAVMGYLNRLDGAALTASSSPTVGVVGNLQHPDINRRWRPMVGAGAAWFVADLGTTAGGIGGVSLINTVGFVAGAAWRIRLSSADATGVAGNLYDTGSYIPPFNPVYPKLVHIVPTADVTGARYLRVDLPAGAGAGRAFVGPLHRPPWNFAVGWKPARQPRSVVTLSRGGQPWIDIQPQRRGWSLTWKAQHRDAVFAEWDEMARRNDTHTDVLVCLDPDSADLGRDTLWGLLGGPDHRSEPVIMPSVTGLRHEVSIEPWERL